ncbi:hypothetical protein [Bythopirellula polymerisocia]|uniref:Uncharacterized protein n=1 Tax=Bythopirellula polymerisocia TaxID=2528003 RepID=A0A5C6CAZ9_9BACT|nr:hypothetical protein [Bythopirellula polymerisocia]TWU21265.1 hypothetical protein Pla144_46740 [Bythopirellula polymerisocia]
MVRCLRKTSASALEMGWNLFWQRVRCFSLVFLLFACLDTALSERVNGASEAHEASTSAEARETAINAIPFAKIDKQFREPMRHVIDDCTIYRRLPTQIVDCDPEMFTYMAQNPDALVEIWKQLGITRVSLERIDGNSFRLADGVGTTGKLVIVEQTCEKNAQNRFVMFGEGAYEGKPFSRPVHAQSVLLLKSGSMVESNGRTYVAAQMDTFLRIDRTSLEILAKAIQPLVGRTADRNFADTMTFLSGFSQASEAQPERIERLALNLPRITPERQKQLVQIAYQTGKHSESESRVRVSDREEQNTSVAR